jgi:uncharacterized membrane protein
MLIAATSDSSALIQDTPHLLVFFAGFIGLVFLASNQPVLKPLFKFIPPIVWIYLLPAVGTSLNITPATSPLYTWCSNILLPAALILLTLSTDIKSIARLGPLALVMILSGTLGIVIGGPVALAIFQSQLDPETWKALGALAGSWIGGGSNMIAIKEGVNCPPSLFSPVIVVDSVVGYGWMAILIALSRYQDRVDKFNGANRVVITDLNQRLSAYRAKNSRPLTLSFFAMILGVGFVGGWFCMWLGQLLPEIEPIMTHFTWGILLILIVGLTLSVTPARRLEAEGASAIAYGGLYFLVATMGATGDLREVVKAPLLIAVGVVWIMIQVVFLAVAMRLSKAPMFLFATGSMGNIGGVISTPVVAGVYQRGLAPVGVLMGVVGNLVGTPAGLFCTYLMSKVAMAYFGAAALGPPP